MAIHDVRRKRAGDDLGIEPGAGMAELRGDCARMAPRWEARPTAAAAAVAARPLRGVSVDPGSVRLVAAMPEYGG
ncbi:hypothetical protein [Streptomyces montanisoli]|uniref:Uncharacterized protein n=1 Tax=Streptomyces montanisoli TaxID=2798581 RepID=A0A940RWL4_9ACTN|nr:hypothetical protein [Streptomyces montanisoli]MBP0460282.1 hypothetical protein [Streptomyces montanisoli]